MEARQGVGDGGSATAERPRVTKLTLNLPTVVFEGIREMATRHARTTTEEIRRALSLWKVLHEEVDKGSRILIETNEGRSREIVLPEW